MRQTNLYKNVDLISGPCSLESRDQTLETARQLFDVGVRKFRGGVWKPRTRPGGFEGIGEPALNWLRDVHKEYGMDVGCEVANKDQVQLALQYGLDFIWVGARTVADPFAIQEISDAIAMYATEEQLMTMDVYIKNPVCPDYDLWYGAYERIKGSGVVNVRFIFRGFKSYYSTRYRNEPIWDIPLKMMTEHPEIKMYCDPSHIAGKRELVGEVADVAINTYNMQGLMIESHCSPFKALTDISQQLLPSDIPTLYEERRDDKVQASTNAIEEKLQTYRNAIDVMDKKIVESVVNRLMFCEAIGDIKAKNGIVTYQRLRWKEVLKKIHDALHCQGNFTMLKKYPEIDYLIEDIFNKIHSTSIQIQKEWKSRNSTENT